jgi:hypothetical protein
LVFNENAGKLWQKHYVTMQSETAIAATVHDAAGNSLVIEGPIDTPSGRRPNIRAVWLIEAAGLAPRFITAYPHRHHDS